MSTNFLKFGLSSQEAEKRLKQFGPNQIFKAEEISFFKIAWHEIREPMILLLLVVGFFYSLWGKLEDALTIFIVILFLVFAEAYNELRAKKAIASLEKITAPKTKVLRNGNITEIDSENVVPDDILILIPGTKIPADAKLKKAIDIEVDESSLTGESFPKRKKRGEKIFAGTILVFGEGEAKVVRTGQNTEMGKVALALKKIKPPKTTLQLAMKSLAGKLVYVALFFSILIPLIGILRGQDLKTMILTGLSLSFATIPEELPIIITMVLGLGAYTLSNQNFLIKKIKSAEVLGNATCIVTDKTGTLTLGKMKISQIYPQNKEREVLENALGVISEYSLSLLEKAIQDKAKEMGIFLPFGGILHERNIGDGKKTKAMVRKTQKGLKLFVSGAPEEVFITCQNVSDGIKKELEKETTNGKRVIAVASKELKLKNANFDFEKIEKEMEFSGLISFEDPPREGVKETIEIAKKAGIKTIMVTGDHPQTASFVAKKTGIDSGRVLTGRDLDEMSDEELKEVVKSTSVFARTSPQHKYRIVKSLQDNDEVVAVTGDGINDVLALKAANIGIAMGKKGTDVAKEAAEIVLADDNFITITQGIFEGRKFFDNLTKGVKYYLSVKVALILIFLLPVLLGLPLPFAPIQIIVLELFMDLAASAGFVAEPKEKGIYSRTPRDPREPIFKKEVIQDILIKGTILFLAVTVIYFYALYQKLSLVEAQTFAFSAWIFGHIVLAFVSRSDKETLFSLGLFTNKIINIWALGAISFLISGISLPILSQRFNLTKINLIQILLIALIVILIIGFLEIKKYFKSQKRLVTRGLL